jgi:K+-sensing histidine kinase KdpD
MDNNFDRLYTVNLLRKINYDIHKEFEDIVALAAEICDTPMALITLLDNDTDHFIAKIGVESNSSPRSTSFCQYGIEQDEVMIVNDTLLDDRFANNPHVKRSGVRFYAGANLQVNNGHKVGSLCVLDRKPRTLTSTQIKTLNILSRQATVLMELELSQKLMKEHQTDIENQNKILMNIAKVHSHDFRGPVASLLGLMHIISEDNYNASKEYLLLMENAIKELDEKIHLIVEYTQII